MVSKLWTVTYCHTIAISCHADELSRRMESLDPLCKTGELRVGGESDEKMQPVSIVFALCRVTLTDLISASFFTSMSIAMSASDYCIGLHSVYSHV